jgi:hypothetical protein
MFLIQIVEQLLSDIPVLEGHSLGIQFVLIELNDRLWVIEYSVVI